MSIAFKIRIWYIHACDCVFVCACTYVCMYLSNRFGTINGGNEVLLLQNHVTLCRNALISTIQINKILHSTLHVPTSIINSNIMVDERGECYSICNYRIARLYPQ